MRNHLLFLLFAMIYLIIMCGCGELMQESANDARRRQAEIVDSFAKTNQSMVQHSPEDLYDAVWRDPAYTAIRPDAQRLKTVSDSTVALVDSMTMALVRIAGGEEAMDNNAVRADTKIPRSYFITKGHGKVLQAGLLSYYNTLADLGPDKVKILAGEKISEAAKPGFSEDNFGHTPLVGALTLLTSFRNSIRGNETNALNYLKTKK